MFDQDGLLRHDELTQPARYRCGLPIAMTMLAVMGLGLTAMLGASLGGTVYAARAWMRAFR